MLPQVRMATHPVTVIFLSVVQLLETHGHSIQQKTHPTLLNNVHSNYSVRGCTEG